MDNVLNMLFLWLICLDWTALTDQAEVARAAAQNELLQRRLQIVNLKVRVMVPQECLCDLESDGFVTVTCPKCSSFL